MKVVAKDLDYCRRELGIIIHCPSPPPPPHDYPVGAISPTLRELTNTLTSTLINTDAMIALMATQFEAPSKLDADGLRMVTGQSNEVNDEIRFEEPLRELSQEPGSLPLDPIQYLPFEISTAIIREAVSAYGGYTAHILDLTSVSQIWRNFILSTPVLWSEIYLDDRQPDFLATVAIFMHLSCEVALHVFIYDRPMNNWAGLLPILAPVNRRIISLTILKTKIIKKNDLEDISKITLAMSDLFDHLGPLPQLQKINFHDNATATLSVFDSLELPSTVRLSGTLKVPISERTLSSAAPGRLFDIDKYNSFVPALLVPLFRSCRLSFGWSFNSYEMIVQMREEPLSHLRCSSDYISGHIAQFAASEPPNSNSTPTLVTAKSTAGSGPAEFRLERFTHLLGTSLSVLEIKGVLSKDDELVCFLRLLTRLESLYLEITAWELKGSPEIASSSIVVTRLQSLFVTFTNPGRLPMQSIDQGFRRLCSALTPLYPSVESLEIWATTWPFFASSYLESLGRLKVLRLNIVPPRDEARYDAKYDSITLHSLERLEVAGQPLIHPLRTPNLLSLSLEKMEASTELELLGVSSLRKLSFEADEEASCTLNPSNYSGLYEIDIGGYDALKRVDILSFPSLSSIRLKTKYFTNPEGNYFCTELLCNPEGCPSLQTLYFEGGLEWDILILMLERRNFGLEGVRKIHTVTLPFVPVLIHETLTLLLAGEKTARPLLESVSLEATREVLFDPTVQGCYRCLKYMIPGCTRKVVKHPKDHFVFPITPDKLYPKHRYLPNTVPGDVRDWMDYRNHLVYVWKSCYREFRQKFTRRESCHRDLYVNYTPWD